MTGTRNYRMQQFPFLICLVLLLVTAGIPIAAASPTLSALSPSTGPNDGDVTVKITGSGFNSHSSIYMLRCPGIPPYSRLYGSCMFETSTSATCSFPLAGQPAGNYNVWVNSPFTDALGVYYPEDVYRLDLGFKIYQATGSGSATTTTTTTETTAAVTTTVSSTGKNSVFFETNPSGATIYLDGDEIGTSAFTYHTDKDGAHSVVVRKIGYEDYEDSVTILEGQRVRFYSLLTPLSSTASDPAATVTSSVSGKPVSTVTTFRKSTLKVPTPLGTDPPVTEEAPVDPAIGLLAAGIGIMFVVIRRR